MTLPATDAFTAADSTALQTYSANWTIQNGGFTITSNAIGPAASAAESGAFWNADTFDNDQYAQGKAAASAGTTAIGVAVRVNTSTTDSYYGFYFDASASQLFKMVSGSWTQLGSNGQLPAVNDVIRIDAVGSIITPRINGAISTTGAQTDTALTSGAAGLSGYSTGTGRLLDDWKGGDSGGFGATVQTAQGTDTGGEATATLAQAATAGNLLIFAVGRSSTSVGGVWGTPTGFNDLPSSPAAAGTNLGAVWWYKIAEGGETTVTTESTNESGNWVAVLVEFEGPFTSSPLDQSAEDESNLTSVDTSQTSGTTGATEQNNELALAFFAADSGVNVDGSRVYSNSFIEEIFGYSSARATSQIAKKILTATGTVVCTFSVTDTGDEMYGAIATFKQAFYYVNQNFEETGFDNAETWVTYAGDVGIVDPDYSTSPLLGSQSLRMNDDDDEGCYAVTKFSDNTGINSLYGFFRLKITDYPSGVPADFEILQLYNAQGPIDNPTSVEQHEMLFIDKNDGHIVVRQASGGLLVATGSHAIQLNTIHYVWFYVTRSEAGYTSGWLKVSESPSIPGSNDASWADVEIVGQSYRGTNVVGFTTLNNSGYEYISDQLVVTNTAIDNTVFSEVAQEVTPSGIATGEALGAPVVGLVFFPLEELFTGSNGDSWNTQKWTVSIAT